MERELILPVKSSGFDEEQMREEIDFLKRLLPAIESFESFKLNTDVFERRSLQLIKQDKTLLSVFKEGLESSPDYYFLSKN